MRPPGTCRRSPSPPPAATSRPGRAIPRSEARHARAPEHRPWAVFERLDGDEYRTVSGRERGERLRLIRDEAGAVVKLSWAGYAFTRTPETFAR